ncbi:hypothetical protein EV360DRAFT_70800 [Lentinula raphanica]|nr:hypothetical protein EV360DRAFT_70800 [Lentinula raphanica]
MSVNIIRCIIDGKVSFKLYNMEVTWPTNQDFLDDTNVNFVQPSPTVLDHGDASHVSETTLVEQNMSSLSTVTSRVVSFLPVDYHIEGPGDEIGAPTLGTFNELCFDPKWSVSLHLALSAAAHQIPRVIAECSIPLEASHLLVLRDGVWALDAQTAIQLMQTVVTPELQRSLSNAETMLASAIEPPTFDCPLDRMAGFRQIGKLGHLGQWDYTIYDHIYRVPELYALDTTTIRAHLSSYAGLSYNPLDPFTVHYVLLLIDPAVPSLPQTMAAPSTSFDHAHQLPVLFPMPSLQYLDPVEQQTPAIVAWNIYDACFQAHHFVPDSFRTWIAPPSGTLIDNIRGWQATYYMLDLMGYNPAKSLKKQYYQWQGGSQDSYEKIIMDMGWHPASFARKCRRFLWAALATAVQIWDPARIPTEDRPTLFAAYTTWRQVLYLWRFSTFLTQGGKPNHRSADQNEANIHRLRQAHIGKYRKIINRYLITRPRQ